MTGGHLTWRWLTGLVDSLDGVGERLLTWYQGITIATCGRLPACNLSALKLGTWTASLMLGGTLLVVVLACIRLGGDTPVGGGPSGVAGSEEPAFVFGIRCRQCGWTRPLGAAGMERGVRRAGAYQCERCRQQTAYPVWTPRGVLVAGQPEVGQR